MSSAETPEDPDTPPPSPEDVQRAVRNWLLFVAGLCMVAMVVIVMNGAK